jgi:hypothetical protein
MSPEERQMLSELFERVRGQANAPRDRDAETLIADAVRAQPYAPYLLAQAVLVQEQALRAADQKLQDMQAQVTHLQQQAQAPQNQGGGSFLGGLFGGGSSQPRPAPQPQQQAPSPWGAAAQQQPSYAPPPPASPWGAPPSQGGGFMKGALGAAAGVAGGVLLADSIRGLMGGGHGGLGGGLGGGLFGGGMGQGLGGGETVVNNFYDSPASGSDQDYQDASDNDDDSGGDTDYGDDV